MLKAHLEWISNPKNYELTDKVKQILVKKKYANKII
jgi:hypothetical protein